jgi:hypothetical protein
VARGRPGGRHRRRVPRLRGQVRGLFLHRAGRCRGARGGQHDAGRAEHGHREGGRHLRRGAGSHLPETRRDARSAGPGPEGRRLGHLQHLVDHVHDADRDLGAAVRHRRRGRLHRVPQPERGPGAGPGARSAARHAGHPAVAARLTGRAGQEDPAAGRRAAGPDPGRRRDLPARPPGRPGARPGRPRAVPGGAGAGHGPARAAPGRASGVDFLPRPALARGRGLPAPARPARARHGGLGREHGPAGGQRRDPRGPDLGGGQPGHGARTRRPFGHPGRRRPAPSRTEHGVQDRRAARPGRPARRAGLNRGSGRGHRRAGAAADHRRQADRPVRGPAAEQRADQDPGHNQNASRGRGRGQRAGPGPLRRDHLGPPQRHHASGRRPAAHPPGRRQRRRGGPARGRAAGHRRGAEQRAALAAPAPGPVAGPRRPQVTRPAGRRAVGAGRRGTAAGAERDKPAR